MSAVEPLADATAEPTHVVSVYGVDHPGIVHRAALALAEHEVNIVDLETRLAEEQGEPSLYALLMEVTLPAELDPATLDAALAELGSQESVEVSLRELDRHEL